MTIFKLDRNDVDLFTVVTNPIRTYASSSTQGVTGSLNVFVRRSPFEKDVDIKGAFVDAAHDDKSIQGELDQLVKVGKKFRNSAAVRAQDPFKFTKSLDKYMNSVRSLAQSTRREKVLDIFRFVPSFNYTSLTAEKLFVKDTLNPYYRTVMPHANWAYTNYNSLNFFTASTVPTSSVLLYPNVEEPGGSVHPGYCAGTYALSGAFSFDFSINPRYTTDTNDGSFKAGTIFHLSSSYAVSLISGSARDENGRASHFRIQLQLSHSANVAPSLAVPGTGQNSLTFRSDDNILLRNNWHRVIIRWGTSLINEGTGSFNVDGEDHGTFVIPSGTVAPLLFTPEPSVLCIGNFYEAPSNSTGSMAQFFALDPSTRDGLEVLDTEAGVETPLSFSFNHPLNAELHDLSIKRYYMTDEDIVVSASRGPDDIPRDRFALFVPPFFVQDSPFMQFVNDHGGVMQTPFFEIDGTTNDPFNVAMSFGVGGHMINLENFVRDFASNVFPKLHHLTGVAINTTTTSFRSANAYLYDQPFVVKRNLTILPCDDGNHVPNYEILRDENANENFVTDLGVEDLSLININEMMNTSSLLFGTDFGSVTKSLDDINDFVNSLVGFTPEQPGLPSGSAYRNFVRALDASVASGTFDPGIQTGAPLTIFNRTRDASSNQVTFFDMSNLFYGDRIQPETLEMVDQHLSGSSGVIKITLKDDGLGNLYRADADTPHAKWNCVGNMYPYEGIIVIKSPHLFFYGQEAYEMSFRGERKVHVMRIDAMAPANQLNSSQNPNFTELPPSANPNDSDTGFIYISEILFHDVNLNVIAKAKLAQPVLKRVGSRIKFSVKYDF